MQTSWKAFKLLSLSLSLSLSVLAEGWCCGIGWCDRSSWLHPELTHWQSRWWGKRTHTQAHMCTPALHCDCGITYTDKCLQELQKWSSHLQWLQKAFSHPFLHWLLITWSQGVFKWMYWMKSVPLISHKCPCWVTTGLFMLKNVWMNFYIYIFVE